MHLEISCICCSQGLWGFSYAIKIKLIQEDSYAIWRFKYLFIYGSNMLLYCMFQKSYTILKEEDIQQRQEEDVTRISTVLSISREAACILLRHYNWYSSCFFFRRQDVSEIFILISAFVACFETT